MGAKVPADLMPNVGGLIQRYFLQFGEASPTDLWKWAVEEWQKTIRGRAIPGRDIEGRVALAGKAISYRGIVRWFYIMRQLDIIEESRLEPAHGFPKRFYRVQDDKFREIVAGLPYKLYPAGFWGGKRYTAAKKAGKLQLGRTANAVGKWAPPPPSSPS